MLTFPLHESIIQRDGQRVSDAKNFLIVAPLDTLTHEGDYGSISGTSLTHGQPLHCLSASKGYDMKKKAESPSTALFPDRAL